MRLGRQEPRLRRVPDYSSSLGDEAIDLAAAAGLVLDRWQQLVVRDVLGVDEYGSWAAMETCTVVSRQQGKGGIIETIELAALFLLGERLILHSAHEYRTANEAFLRIKALIEGNGDLSRHVRAIRTANGEQQVELLDGARLRFVARSKGSGRGFSAPRNILDEAYALTYPQYAALLPTVSAQPNPQINMFSTVPDVDTMPADPSEAVLPQVHKRALSPSPGRLCYHDWSVLREELPAGDPLFDPAVFEQYIDLAYEANPALGIRISEEYVRGELLALGPAKFSVERLSVWPMEHGAAWLAFSQQAWQDAQEQFDPPSSLALCITVSPDRQWASICAAGAIGDGKYGVAILDRREGTGWVVDRLFERARSLNPVAVLINRSGPEGSLWAEVSERNLGASALVGDTVVELVPVGPQNVAAADEALWDGICGPPSIDPDTGEVVNPRVVRHLGQKELTDSAAGAVWKVSVNGSRQFDPAVGDPSTLKGCALALQGFREREPAMETPWVWDGTL